MKPPLEDIHIKPLICRFPRLKKWSHREWIGACWRIYWSPDSGAQIVLENGDIVRFSSDYVYLIPPGVCFEGSSSQPIRQFYIHFVTRLRYHPNGASIHVIPVQPQWSLIFDEIGSYQGTEAITHTRVSLLATSMSAELLCRVPSACFEDRIEDPRIQMVKQYVSDHLCEALDNNTLAQMVGMNTNAFILFFKTQTGQTPQVYVSGERVKNASMLLAHTDLSIETVAEESGFCDRFYFGRVFKKYARVSPAAYRDEILTKWGLAMERPSAKGNADTL